MRDPRDWDEDYILNLPTGELDWFEAKGRRTLDLTLPNIDENTIRSNLSKAISAFANSGGGTLILGITSAGGKWQVDDGGVDLTIRKNTREWLEDVIPNLVEFPLHSFNVYVVERMSDTSQIAPGRGIFLIDVHDSEQAPHQANDNVYYARVAGKSRPISHRLVADIFGRRRDPIIELEFRIVVGMVREGDLSDILGFSSGLSRKERKKVRKVELGVDAKNVGRVYAQYANCYIYLPVSLIDRSERELFYPMHTEINGIKYVSSYDDNSKRDVIKYRGPVGGDEYGPTWFSPILPGRSFSMASHRLRSDFDLTAITDEEIVWEVYADNSTKRTGKTKVKDIPFRELQEEDEE